MSNSKAKADAAEKDLEMNSKLQEEGDGTAHAQDTKFSLDYISALLSQTDDPSTPALTIRSVSLGVLWGFFLAALNIVGTFRDIPLVIPTSLASILTYPMGIFLARILPSHSLINPGPFSIKEHVLVYIIASSAGARPYGINNVIGQKLLFHDTQVTLLNALAWTLVTQLVGFGIAGIFRRFLVRPTAMLWPAALAQVAFFNAFHETKTLDDLNQGYGADSWSRYKAFWVSFACMFVWSWFPAYFMKAFGMIAVLCLIPGASRQLRFLGSGSNKVGPGILSFTLDWTQITGGSQVVYNPWATTVNFAVGGILFAWIIGPIWFYTKPFTQPTLESTMYWGGYTAANASIAIHPSKYVTSLVAKDPIPVYNSNSLYDSNGYILSVSQGVYPKLLDSSNNLNLTSYQQAGSRIFLSPAMSLMYFTSFISLGAVFSQVFLWYGRDLYQQLKAALSQSDDELYVKDIHARLLRAYADVKDWHYIVYFVVMVVAAVCVCETTPFKMQWWLTLICISVGFLFTLPVGIIQAVTGYQPGLNILTQVIAGFLVPGHTTSVMAFKTMGYDISIQALNLSLDLKLGQYMHISPLSLVYCQLLGTVLGSLTMTVFAFLVMDAQPSEGQWQSPWGFNGYRTFANAGGIWGAIGPERFFGPASPYFALNWGYVFGFIGPFIPFLLNKVYPHKNWRKVNIVLISAAYITMQTGNPQIYIFAPVLAGWFFQRYLFKNHRLFWNKYAWIIATGFDSAAPLSIFLSKILEAYGIEAPAWSLNPQTVPPDYYCFDTSVQ